MSAARDGQFDLVILDLGLPGRDGLDALSDIRSRGDRLPVIVLTARDAVADGVAGLERGADDYVTKPFSFQELLAGIRVRLRDSGREEATLLRRRGPGARPADPVGQRWRAIGGAHRPRVRPHRDLPPATPARC